MKKSILILAIIFTSNLLLAQGMFDKLEDLDDVSAVVVTKDAFDLLKLFPDAKSDDMEIFNTAKGLEELKVFSTENTTIATKMESMVDAAIKTNSLTQLMRVKDDGTRVKIYVKSTKTKEIVSEVLMFVKNKDDNGAPTATVISLLGNIDVNKLSKIANDYQKKSN